MPNNTVHVEIPGGQPLESGQTITIDTGPLLCGDYGNIIRVGFPTAYLLEAIEQAQRAAMAVKGIKQATVSLVIVVKPYRDPTWSAGLGG